MDLLGNLRVLIVDDDPGIRNLLMALLRRGGFHLMEACDGREALSEMAAGNVDLVIMDLMMPGVSGWDVLRERAADPSLMAIPMIVVTASNSREVRDDLIHKGVYAVLAKPFDIDTLLTTVRACLGQHPDAPVLVAA